MLRQSAEDGGGLALLLASMLSCLAVLYWRLTLIIILIAVLTAFFYGVVLFAEAIG
jgi:hypothetical protein